MKDWQINKVFYYEVNNRKFYDKNEAEEYSLKVFLVNEINNLWDKKEGYDNYSIFIDKDNKTIIKHIYHEPIVDNWNVGHYGCTEPTIIDKSVEYKYNSLKEFYEHNKEIVEELFSIAAAIDLEKISIVCNKETTNELLLYKEMVEKIRSNVNFLIEIV